MKQKSILYCFKLFLLVPISTAAPSSGDGSQTSSQSLEDNPESLSDNADVGQAPIHVLNKLKGSPNHDLADDIPDSMNKVDNEALAPGEHQDDAELDAPVSDNTVGSQNDKQDAAETSAASVADDLPDGANKVENEAEAPGEHQDSAAETKNEARASGEHQDDVDNSNNSIPDQAHQENSDDPSKPVVLPEISEESHKETAGKCKLSTTVPKYSIKKLASLSGFKLDTAEMKKFKIWPGGIIPYYIDSVSFGLPLREKIRNYLDEAGTLTGLRFQEETKPDAAPRIVFFLNRRAQLDCNDYTTDSFTNSGTQRVVVGYDCLNDAGFMASVVLALAGIPPQHNSPDRDDHIKVSKESIQPKKARLFKKLHDGDWLFHDLPYDSESAGHYSSHKYSANGLATITFLKKNGDDESTPIEGGNKLSLTDIKKVRILYNDITSKSLASKIKPGQCKALYHAGPNFGRVSLVGKKKMKAPRPKPVKYLEGAKLMSRFHGERLSSIE